MPTLNLQVAANGDDWFFYTIWGNNSFNTFGNFFATARCGCRFTGIDIPAGATITAAVLTFKSVGGNAGDGNAGCNVRISANLADNPAAPGNQAADDGLALTTNVYNWTGAPTISGEADYATPDITPIINELYAAGYLTGGKSCILLVRDNSSSINAKRTFFDYNNSPTKAPKLDITYTAPAAYSKSSSSALTLASASSEVATFVESSVSALTFASASSEVATFVESTASALTFGSASVMSFNVTYAKSSASGLVFSSSSSEVAGFVESSASGIVFAAASMVPSINHTYSVSTSSGILFRVRSRVKGKEVVFGDTYRGSAQQGAAAPLFVQARDGRGVPTTPTSQVSDRVYRLGSGVVSDGDLAIVPHARAKAVVAGGPTLGADHPPGRYFALCHWSVEEFGGIELSVFEVLPGGDPRGPVIAAHDVRRPEARHVLAQVGGGLVLGGRNPRART